jgi:putative addiction module component (TIGR02574 family)
MSPTVESLGIDRLTFEQRLALVQEIWNLIAAEPHPPLPNESQRRELKRRAAKDEATPEDVISWDQVKGQALSRLRQCRR